MSILVVDDDAACRRLAVDTLRALGYRAESACDGQAAIDACRAQPPGLVLMDVQMPRLDGLEATAQLVALQRLGVLPRFAVIGVTGMTHPEQVQRCLAAGMTEVLAKPIELTRLAMVVGRHTPAPTVRETVPRLLHDIRDEH